MAENSAKKAPKKYLHVKHLVKKMQNRAKWVGVLYVIAMLAITALACFQVITFDGSEIGVLAFWKPFKMLASGNDIIGTLLDNVIVFAIALLYGIMLLTLLANVISAFCHMGWLFKKKASKLYGFNRNMYAMDDIEKKYSSSLKTIICIYFLIAVFATNVEVNLLLAGSLLGVGVLFHFFCGLLAGHTSLFTVDGEIIEEKRKVGTFSVFMRNFFQVLATTGVVFFFVKSSGALTSFIETLLADGIGAALSDPLTLVMPAARLVLLVLFVWMICYVFGTREFDPSGKKVGGRGTFLWLSFITFIVAFGVAVFYALTNEVGLNGDLMAIAGISLVAFILEICLKNFPRTKEKNPDDVDANEYLKQGVTEDGQSTAQQPQQPIPPVMYLPVPMNGQNQG